MNPVLPVAPAAEVTRPPTGAPPGDPPGDFGPVLAQAAQTPGSKGRNDGARTATAEGAKTEAAESGSGETDTAATDAATGAAAAEADPSAAAAVQAAAPAATAAPLPESAPAAPANAAPASETAPAVPQQPQAPAVDGYRDPAAPQDGTVVKAPPGEVAHAPVPTKAEAAHEGSLTPATGEAEQRAATGKQAAPAGAASAATAQPAETSPAAPPSDTPAAQAAPAQGGAALKTHDEHPPGREQQGKGQTQSQAAEVPAPKSDARKAPETAASAQPQADTAKTAAAAKPDAPAPSRVDTTTQPQPVSTSAPQQAIVGDRPAGTDTPVRAHSSLAQLAETARTVVRMAARDGAAQAHITLHPAELGEVSIRLRYHAGGVSADVLADSQAAAQALQGAASELRRSLEAQGLTVHALDVRAGEQEQQQRAHEQHGHGGHRGHGHAETYDLPDQTTIDTSSLPLPTGGVDVLA